MYYKTDITLASSKASGHKVVISPGKDLDLIPLIFNR